MSILFTIEKLSTAIKEFFGKRISISIYETFNIWDKYNKF